MFNVKPDHLFLIRNEEDECWEILERNGCGPREDDPDDDALIAKFYHCPRCAEFLILALQRIQEISGEEE